MIQGMKSLDILYCHKHTKVKIVIKPQVFTVSNHMKIAIYGYEKVIYWMLESDTFERKLFIYTGYNC